MIYLQDANSYGQPVAIKLLKADPAAPRELDRFANEYNLTRALSLPGIRCAYDSLIVDGRPALILEYIEGETLQKAFVEERRTLAEVLTVAISIAQALNDLHRQHIVHRNLTSVNILIQSASHPVGDRQQQTATLIDFGLAAPVDPRTGHLEIPAVLEGSLPYLSPEQTGRTNQFVDYRSDLYSLGVILYEVLSGKLPFDAADPAELVHCHIARIPKPVGEIDSTIPPVISAIVMKLLAKSQENRYQSAYGLKVDLEKCLNQLNATGAIEAFELGSEDASWIFQVSPKLYGREQELQTLLAMVDGLNQGEGEILLVTGQAGVGKSSLIGHIHRAVVEIGGYFITGGCDEYHQNTPYFALIQAFTRLVDLILMESAEQLAQLKLKLTQALGANGGLLIEVIPQLELIIGPQPPVPELGTAEAQHRFHHTLRSFIRAMAQKSQPLVVFIDNLQWADTASLELLKLLLAGVKHQHWLFIGAYRDNEVGPAHPLIAVVETLAQFNTAIKTVHLENLSPQAVNLLVSATLKSDPPDTETLTELIMEKTGGNPLFAAQFLQSLHEEGLLVFNFDTRQWVVWDTEQIRGMDITTNVATLMTQKIEKLPEKTRHMLFLAACMGPDFALEDLATIAHQSIQETFDRLGKAIEEGLILPAEGNYLEADRPNRFEFLHDRVRQAAYALLPKKQKKWVHLNIGRLRLLAAPEAELEEHIFELADHFNQGFQYLKDEREKLRVIELNFSAGRKAKRAAAYRAAIWYLEMGIGMLPPDKWEQHYNLTLSLYLEAVEAEYRSTNFERAELLSTEVLQHVQDLLNRVKVYELRILFYTAQNQNSAAIKAGLEALELLGIYLPTGAREQKAYTEELKKELAQEIDQIDSLALLPLMQDSYQLAAMHILMGLAAPAYQANDTLLTIIIFKMVLMSARYGNSPAAAFAYGWYAVLLCGVSGDIEKGYQFGQLSLQLIRQFQATELEARILFLFNIFVRPWKEHARETIRPLQEVYQRGLETGDLEYTYYGAVHYCSYLFCSGGTLAFIHQRQAEYLEPIERSRLEFQSSFIRIWGQTVLNLLSSAEDTTLDPGRLSGNLLDESKMLPLWIEQNDQVLVFCALCCRTMLQFLFGNYAGAIESARLGERYEKGGEGYIYLVEHSFYHALALLAHYPQADPQTQQETLRKVAVIQGKMGRWADHAPMNFKHKYDLIEAERARVTGETLKAMEAFGQAIKGAKENGYIHEEALAHEREAEFYIALAREDFAGLCLRKAGDCYRLWGATRKVEDLENRYRHLLVKDRAASLDKAAIIKASHMLSQEIRLEQLLDKVIRLVIENAGAEKGILIEYKNNKLVVQAKGAIEPNQVETMQDLPIAESKDMPMSVVNYVARTQMPVVLGNAFYDSAYAADKYIAEHQVRSLLCLPIVHQAKLSGLLYLENNLAANVFTPDRLELLKALVSQAAISMENARLYANLEKNFRELKQVEEALRESEERYRSLFEDSPVSLWEDDFSACKAYLDDLRAAGVTDFRAYFEQQPTAVVHCLRLVKLLDVNQATLNLTGVSSKEELLTNWLMIFTEASLKPFAEQLIALIESKRQFENEGIYQTLRGEERIVQLYLVVAPGYERSLGKVLISVIDITDRKQAEAEREALIEELESKNAELERFTYTVSHDLKSPLVTIRGFLGYLEQDALSGDIERTKEDVARITNAAEKMEQLLHELLELSRIGRLMNPPEKVSLGDLVQEALDLVAGQLAERGIRVKVAPDLPPVYGDRPRLREVLQNLVDNAVKYLGDQPDPCIEIGVRLEEGGAKRVFYVRDNGQGIDPRYHTRVFNLFEKLDQTSKGTGVGLAIVKRIVEVHGGRIWVESAGVGCGSTFCFTLPHQES